MTTLSEIITPAFRRLGIVTAARPLKAFDESAALTALNDIIARLPDWGVGDVLTLQRVDSSITVSVPAILHVITGGVTITLPEDVRDGYRVKIVDVGANFATSPVTIARNGWLIAASASDVTLSTNGQSKEYMFRADLGSWQDITQPLAKGADSPFPASFDEPLKAMLALRMAEEKRLPISDALAMAAASGLSQFQAQYGPDMAVSFDVALRSSPSHIPLNRTSEIS